MLKIVKLVFMLSCFVYSWSDYPIFCLYYYFFMNLRNLGLHDILIEQNRNVIWIYMRYILFLKAKYIVRSGIRTHAHIRGPERSVPCKREGDTLSLAP